MSLEAFSTAFFFLVSYSNPHKDYLFYSHSLKNDEYLGFVDFKSFVTEIIYFETPA